MEERRNANGTIAHENRTNENGKPEAKEQKSEKKRWPELVANDESTSQDW